MNLTRTQKASLLKEIGNLISYFQTPEKMDIEKFISILRQKYPCWNEITADEKTIKIISTIINNLEHTLDEKMFITNTFVEEENDTTVPIYSNNVSITYLSSEPTFFEDELISTDINNSNSNDTFTFTGFSSDNFQDTNAITISPEEFWSDDENKDDFND